MNHLDDMQRSILLEGLRDYQSLWELAREARDLIGSQASTDAVRRTVLAWIQPLVEGGYVAVGELVRRGRYTDVHPWFSQGGAAMRELEQRWVRLGRDPAVGEIAWLQLTPSGETLARNMEASA